MINRRYKFGFAAAILSLTVGPLALGGLATLNSDLSTESFRGLDTDGDGYVNQHDTLFLDPDAFVAADTNLDGRLDAAEYSRFLGEMANAFKNQGELSKEMIMHLVTAGGKTPFPAAGLIE